MTLVHGSRAGVILDSCDCDFPLFDADDPFDDADIQPLTLEIAALLDVQLEIRRDVPALAPRFREPRRVPAEKRDSLFDRLPAPRLVRELRCSELPTHGAAPVESSLLILPHHHFEWVSRANALLRQGLGDFDGRERADISVVVPALGHAVDVRTEHDWLERAVRAAASSENVAGKIDLHVEVRRAHEVHDVGAAGAIEVGVRHARHAALRIGAERRQLLEVRVQSSRVDSRRVRQLTRNEWPARQYRAGKYASECAGELAAIHHGVSLHTCPRWAMMPA